MAAILVIDPSPTIRETLRIVLGGEHVVSIAASWTDVVRGTPPDLVIFGAPPPPRDDAADRDLRARVAPEAPLLLLNPATAEDLRALAPPGHRIEFLPKPFDAKELRRRVQRLLAPVARRVPSDAAAARHQRWLAPPFVTAAAALARRASVTDLPVLLIGERGTGAIEVARAIQFFGGGGQLIARAARDVTSDLLPAGAVAAPPGAVLIEDVQLLSTDAQHVLLECLRARADGEPAPRVFATTPVDLETDAPDEFTPELAYALGAVPIVLTPLRDRLADLPALVDALLPALVRHARLEAVTVTAAALARLQRYLWFGNVAELEVVLARTLAWHRPRVVEAEMLVFTVGDAARAPAPTGTVPTPAGTFAVGASAATPARAPRDAGDIRAQPADPLPPTTPTAPPAPSLAPAPAGVTPRGRVLPLERRRPEEPPEVAALEGGARAPLPATSAPTRHGTESGAHAGSGIDAGAPAAGTATAGPSLEVLLGELAHELRNPMVTIKTFAQHLDNVLDDPEVRARFASLAGEAITRMDALLETLLDFARFRAPIPQSIELTAVLARALDERADELARKEVHVEREAGASCPVEADEAQMLFAFRSLIDGLVRDLTPRGPLRVAARGDGALELTVRADRAIAARLAAYVGDAGDVAEAATPLAFALAAALVRRNGGRLEARAGEDGTTIITVRIPRTVARGER